MEIFQVKIIGFYRYNTDQSFKMSQQVSLLPFHLVLFHSSFTNN